MMRHLCLTAAAAALIVAAGPSVAQERLIPGRGAVGQLATGDDRLASGEFVDHFTIEGRAGQTLTLRLTSSDFDPYLMVRGPGGFSEDNDDGDDGSTNSLIHIRLPADGSYQISATSYQAGERGYYQLSADVTGGYAGGYSQSSPQTGGRLSPGDTIRGELGAGDDRLSSGEFVDSWTLSGRAGQVLTVRMNSAEFDPYLMIRGPADFTQDNDDGGDGSTNSLLQVRLPVGGEYRISATSFQPGERGRYDISIDGEGGYGGPRQTPSVSSGGGELRAGSWEGSLSPGDQTLSTGEYADSWSFHARRGTTYEVSLSSAEMDPYLVVRGPGGFSEDNDDDPSSRGSTNSRIRFTAEQDGEVSVAATSFRPGERGRYVIQLSESSGDGSGGRNTFSDGTAIRIGDTRQGRLGQGDLQLQSGEYFSVYEFDGRRGQRVDLGLSSSDFDPYLGLNGPDGFSAFNDDDAQAGTRDSRLVATLPEDGRYQLVVTTYSAGEAGSYRLTTSSGGGAAAPEPANRPTRPERPAPVERPSGDGFIRVGEAVRGSLSGGDTQLQSGEYSDTYRFEGRRGERVAIDLTSSAFDTYLILRPPSGDQVDNDDGPDGTNSQIEDALPEDGVYELQVTSYQPGELGDYRLSITPSQGSERQASVQGGQRVFAVMVGVSEYGGAANDLAYTDEDAQKLEESLRRAGVLNPASVTLTNADATVAGVQRAFQQVAAQAGPDDIFLFFFSGHGNQEDGSVSTQEPDGKTETIVLRDGSITDQEMSRMFAGLNTRLSLLVLDSCFSGGFARNVVDRPGVMGLFSSEEDLTSAVADKFEAGGYLALFLREGLSGSADEDGDRMVTAGELASYLRTQFNREVQGVEATTQDGQRNYQNLVVDRGGVQVDDVVLRLAAR